MIKPLKIGITGGIGGGKSSFATLLRERGYAVYDTDQAAKRLQEEDESVRCQLTALFGEKIYAHGKLNKKLLADVVFDNSEALQRLNKVVHPAVERDFKRWLEEHRENEFVFAESAILFESGFDKLMDRIIVVTAPENVRVGRVMKRDRLTAEEVLKRMKNQLPEEEKILRADMVVDNADRVDLPGHVDSVLDRLNNQVR